MYVCMYICMYVWLCWVFVSVRGLSLVMACGGHSSLRCMGLSLSWPLVAEHRLQTRRLSNCGSRAELLRGMWDLPRSGLKPTSPALAGRFSTTAPPGKPLRCVFISGSYHVPLRTEGTHFSTIPSTFIVCSIFANGHSECCELIGFCNLCFHAFKNS